MEQHPDDGGSGMGSRTGDAGADRSSPDGAVPDGLAQAAAVAWRALIVAAAVVVAAIVLVRLRVVVVPLVAGLFLAAVLAPPANALKRRGWPPLLATWVVAFAALLVVVAIGWALLPSIRDGFVGLGESLGDAYDRVSEWVVEGPLDLDPATVQEMEDLARERLRDLVQTGLADRAAFLLEVITAVVLTIVIGFFYVKDGPMFRDRLIRFLPDGLEGRARAALDAGWRVLQRYLVGVVVVGAVDATLIGIGLAVIGVPSVVALMVVTFFAAFFPLVGAILAGGVASLIALASGGAGDALLVLGLTVVVQQVDGDVVAPLVFSRAVDLHPLAILLALTAGGIVAGIIGAFLAVPLLAVSLVMVRSWRAGEPVTGAGLGGAGGG
jgi:putative heme transporter